MQHLLLVLVALAAPRLATAQRDSGLVNLGATVSTIRVAPARAPILVKPSVAVALAKVAKRLASGGVALEVMAGQRNVAGHERGSAIDCQLVDLSRGTPLPMGSSYSEDDKPDTSAVGARELRYRGLLQRIMTEEGFVGDQWRWWHWTAGERSE